VGVTSPALKQLIFMEMKLSQFSSYWNPDMAIKEQGPGRHCLSGAPY
jgi:hypothetical protein